jgi:hypothetical protein
MKTDIAMRHLYYRHTKADTRRLPPCDDLGCLDRVWCTQTWYDTEEQYKECVDNLEMERQGHLPLVQPVAR